MNTKDTSNRKKDHISLAFQAQTEGLDARFFYEPILNGHPTDNTIPTTEIANKKLRLPLWVSSMTGGTNEAANINKNLALACEEFGMGLGLGSCRILLDDNKYLSDFDVRKYMPNQPLFANLGIAQVEKLLKTNKESQIEDLLAKLQADGLIIHINPIQEYLQPEGDRIFQAPIETIKQLLEKANYKIIIKEVGQGFGPKSIIELMQLPIEAIEFGAHGGTNFATLELLRHNEAYRTNLEPLSHIGHNAFEMADFVNYALEYLGDKAKCNNFIASGGIKSFLDGYYLINKINGNAIYAQASAFLKHAQNDYTSLAEYCQLQQKGLAACYQYLQLKP